MAPGTTSINAERSKSDSSDALTCNMRSSFNDRTKSFAPVRIRVDTPSDFDFLRLFYESAIAGGVAGVVADAALHPIDTIKTRLQVAHAGGNAIFHGLYSGLVGNLVGTLPASAMFVGIYEPVKQKLLNTFPENFSSLAFLAAGIIGGAASSIVRVPTEARRNLNGPETAILGAFAGAITGALTTPLDVIKTRLMVQGSASHYKGISDCVRTILKEEGPSALLTGLGPRVLWISLGGSIFFGVLEKTKQVLAERYPRNLKSH